MRKIIAAATFGLVLGVAGASNSSEQAPEARAYFAFSFGGEKTALREFHYGLRLDHDSRHVDRGLPPLMQFDFTRTGFNAAHVNGMNVVRQSYRLHQAEQPAAEEAAPAEEAPAEEAPAKEASADEGAEAAEGGEPQGFFSKTWAGIKGFFGGGDEEAEEAADAGATEEPAAETADAGATADGPFANFGLVDWGLLAVGAVGLGYAASEVSNSADSAEPGGGTNGGTSGTTGGGCNTSFLTTTCVTTPTYAPNRWTTPYDVEHQSAEYTKWLDGGTGQMGDLGGR